MAGDAGIGSYMKFRAPDASGTYRVAIYVNGEYHGGGSGFWSGAQISDYSLNLPNLKCFTVSGWVERTS